MVNEQHLGRPEAYSTMDLCVFRPDPDDMVGPTPLHQIV
jgi:hypothetical protein